MRLFSHWFSCHLNELVGTHFPLEFRLAGKRRIGDGRDKETNRPYRIVIARDNIINAIRVAVTVNDTDDRNTQFPGFRDRDTLVIDINDEQGVRQAAHFLDTTKTGLELFQITLTRKGFFFGELFECAISSLAFQISQTTNGLTNRLVVRQHATQPTFVNVWHPCALGIFLDDLTGTSLRANEQNLVLFRCGALNKGQGLVQCWNSLFKVDDVDIVSGPKNEFIHLGIPISGLVTKVRARLKQVPHRYARHSLSELYGLSLHTPHNSTVSGT